MSLLDRVERMVEQLTKRLNNDYTSIDQANAKFREMAQDSEFRFAEKKDFSLFKN